MKLDHGEYRSCFARMADDADFQSMSGDAFKLLWTLKLTLPVTGIGVVYTSLLAEKTGFDAVRVEALLASLAEPKAYNDLGWIVRDRNIVWVVKALACEPNLTPDNGKKHRPYVQRLVKALPESSPAVRTFKRFYAEWFPDEPIVGTDADTDSRRSSEKSDRVSGTVSPTVSGTHGDSSAIQKQLQGTVQTTIKGEAVDLEHPTAGGAVDASAAGSGSATDSPAAQGASNSASPGTPPADDAGLGSLWQLLRECYQLTGKPTAASSERQKQVYRDLRATLNAKGALLERDVYVRAVDAAHLNDVCRHVLTRVEDNDAAIRLVLLELRDTWQGVKAAREKAALGEEPAPRRTVNQKPAAPSSIASLIPKPKTKGLEDAERWLAAIADERRTAFTTELERLVASTIPPDRAPSWRAQYRAEKLVELWQRETAQEGAA